MDQVLAFLTYALFGVPVWALIGLAIAAVCFPQVRQIVFTRFKDWALAKLNGKTAKAIAMILIPLFMSGAMSGCATKPTKTQYIAAAKIIAREAGNLVAMNNPEMATAVRLGYNMIKDEDGDEFRALFANGLQQMLAAEGVAGSDRLAQSAADLLAVFGLDVPDTGIIDAEYLEKFAVDDIKDLAIAFIEGMGPG